MNFDPASVSEILQAPFDDIIDVRSPGEYLEDHVPRAVNMPVLDDAERRVVGTIYTRESRFEARRVGAAMVARNAARHLETFLASKSPSYRPLIYCWRGGQRSAAFAEILGQVGFRVAVLAGGYRNYRRLVREFLYAKPFTANVVLLDGNTGTAKTEILGLLDRRGVQTLDLERLANHRGSLFGALPGGQPTQKWFEGSIAAKLAGFDLKLPVVVEAESSKIGNRLVPPSLWKRMTEAGRIEISAPLQERSHYIVRNFQEFTRDRSRLIATVEGLKPFHSSDAIGGWRLLAQCGEIEQLARELMEAHYDPRYRKHRGRGDFHLLASVRLERLDGDGLDAAAREISNLLIGS